MKQYLKYGLMGLGIILCIGSVGTMDINPDANMIVQLLVIAIGIIACLLSMLIDEEPSRKTVIEIIEPDGRRRFIRGWEYMNDAEGKKYGC